MDFDKIAIQVVSAIIAVQARPTKQRKPSFGSSEGMNYAVNVKSLDSNEFYKQPFGRQLEDLKKIGSWKETAKKGYVGAKGTATMPAVRRWVRENSPTEFYARWKADSSMYKNDSVEIYWL